MHRERLGLMMTGAEVVAAMSDGNPGAVDVILRCIQNGAAIDPDHLLGPIGAIMHLDSLGVYGSRIWILYKNVCDSDLATLIGVLRASQLGIIPRKDVIDSIAQERPTFDVPFTMAAVRERLPKFQRPADVPAEQAG